MRSELPSTSDTSFVNVCSYCVFTIVCLCSLNASCYLVWVIVNGCVVGFWQLPDSGNSFQTAS